jgi:hypothetical protein
VKSTLLAIAVAAVLAVPAQPQTLGTPGTEVLFLVTDCTAAGHAGGTCFESIDDLLDAIWGIGGLHPDSSHPLIVDIGPGTFAGSIACVDGGYVTFRGAGRDLTHILATLGTAASGENCERLGFQDLDLEGGFWGATWSGSGSASWTDVDFLGGISGWQDFGCEDDPTDPPSATHVFWNSRIQGRISGVISECASSKFFGSRIVARPVDDPVAPAGVAVGYRAELRLFATDVRLALDDFGEGSAPAEVYGVSVGGGFFFAAGYGEVEVHGGSVRVDASSEAGVDAVALSVDRDGVGDARARTLETDFAITPGAGGTPIRVTGDGTIESAFLWAPGADVPIAGLDSKTGMDLYVETDCDATGDCSVTADPPLNPHLMVYRTNCGSKWFDSVTGACKP